MKKKRQERLIRDKYIYIFLFVFSKFEIQADSFVRENFFKIMFNTTWVFFQKLNELIY